MSHIGNKLRAGYFATPISQGKLVKQLLEMPNETTILDPTCGEGLILEYIATGQKAVQTYGVEIDKSRAMEAGKRLGVCLQAPIESCVISNNFFGGVWLNPPYDYSIKGFSEDTTERKEYTELLRGTRYLKGGGVMIYIIPSYRFADAKIARFLATQFEKVSIGRFGDEDYYDFSQCVFIGEKKQTKTKLFSQKMFEYLQNMQSDEFVLNEIPTLEQLVHKGKRWTLPHTPLAAPTFYTRLESKENFIPLIRENKGYQAFKERSKPRDIRLNGQPIINISQGQMALLLASGMVNGVVGQDEHLHALQGLEIVTVEHEKEESENGVMHISRTKRSVSIKVLTPEGEVYKLQ